ADQRNVAHHNVRLDDRLAAVAGEWKDLVWVEKSITWPQPSGPFPWDTRPHPVAEKVKKVGEKMIPDTILIHGRSIIDERGRHCLDGARIKASARPESAVQVLALNKEIEPVREIRSERAALGFRPANHSENHTRQ